MYRIPRARAHARAPLQVMCVRARFSRFYLPRKIYHRIISRGQYGHGIKQYLLAEKPLLNTSRTYLHVYNIFSLLPLLLLLSLLSLRFGRDGGRHHYHIYYYFSCIVLVVQTRTTQTRRWKTRRCGPCPHRDRDRRIVAARRARTTFPPTTKSPPISPSAGPNDLHRVIFLVIHLSVTTHCITTSTRARLSCIIYNRHRRMVRVMYESLAHYILFNARTIIQTFLRLAYFFFIYIYHAFRLHRKPSSLTFG